MSNGLFLLNFFFLFFFFLLLARSWGYVGTLLVVEALWVVLYSLFVTVAPATHELSFFFAAVVVLILSAVELVLGLLCFIIFYHTTGASAPHRASSLAAASLSSRLGGVRALVRTFF